MSTAKETVVHELNKQPEFSNSAIWDEVQATDPSATKGYKGAGGFAGTAISSLYPVKRATMIFGPVGYGWGYEIKEESYIQGAPIVMGDLGVVGNEQTHTLRVELWAMINGKKATCEHYGHTPHIYTNKHGVQTDHEAAKKSLTDAIKKALTMWGFSADVFMGLYDDPEYVKAQSEKEALEKTEDKESVALEQAREYDEWKATNAKLIADSVSLNELQALFVAAVKKAKRKEDDDFIKKITKLKDKRKEELQVLEQNEESQ